MPRLLVVLMDDDDEQLEAMIGHCPEKSVHVVGYLRDADARLGPHDFLNRFGMPAMISVQRNWLSL